MPEISFHAYQVDNAFEAFFGADGNLNCEGVSSEHVFYLTHHFKEVCAGAVHLVDVTDAGHVVFVSLPPHCFRLRFYATNGAESSNGPVEHTEAAFNFYGEVYVPGSVDEVYFEFLVIVVPERCGGGGSNCNAAFLFLFHPVHSCGAVVHFADFVCKACVEQNAFGCGGFTGIDVSHDADIACVF